MRKSKQVNNLKIKFSRKYEKYQIITPDKRVLEEFNTLEQAEECAKTIKDFKKVNKINKINKITDVEKLCELVNLKYNLKPNQIGSIEYHSDMCENSIIQIANKFRGHIQLAYGDNKTLIKYLQGILEDKINLYIYEIN